MGFFSSLAGSGSMEKIAESSSLISGIFISVPLHYVRVGQRKMYYYTKVYTIDLNSSKFHH